jgi:hypothetical protein
MSDRVSQICQEVNTKAKEVLNGIAQPLADAARCAQASAEAFQREHAEATAVVNGSDVASRGEIEREPSLASKVRHLRFIAEAAERAEAELREEVAVLREHVADLADILAETATRRALLT